MFLSIEIFNKFFEIKSISKFCAVIFLFIFETNYQKLVSMKNLKKNVIFNVKNICNIL